MYSQVFQQFFSYLVSSKEKPRLPLLPQKSSPLKIVIIISDVAEKGNKVKECYVSIKLSRESDRRFSTSVFFCESVSSGPLGIPFWPLRIRGDIRNFVGIADDKLSTSVNNTGKKLLPVSRFITFINSMTLAMINCQSQ
jgi:hypothetical protein